VRLLTSAHAIPRALTFVCLAESIGADCVGAT
jgi:hypothetical protein